MKKHISDKDKKDWQEFIKNKENLPNKDLKDFKINQRISKSFDLHGYTLEEANKKINDLIVSSYEKGINKLIIVTGKGLHSTNEKNPYVSANLGILKHSVPEYIYKNKDLLNLIKEIKGASTEDGGSGAFYIYLKKKKL